MEFTPYKSYDQISAKLRRLILEETCETRVKNVSLATCNEILQKHFEEDQENESLKHYEIEFVKDGKQGTVIADTRQGALVEVDRILEYGENKDPSVVIAVRQAKRLINGYIKGQWIFPEPHDKVRFVSRT